jgi:carbon monoxide dehydrogenase subunit G
VKVAGERTFDTPQQTVWEVLNDPARLAKTIPGVESFDVQDERNWHANCNIPLGLGSLKMRIRFEKTEERPPEYAKLKAKGEGVGAIMSMETQFQLSSSGSGTLMRWEADVSIAGPVGSMGQRVLQPIVQQQVANVLDALDQQVLEAARAGSAALGEPTPSIEDA